MHDRDQSLVRAVHPRRCVRATLLHNPHAGRRAPKTAELVAAVEALGWTVAPVDVADLETAIRHPGDVLLVVGGDGTIGTVAKRLAGTGIPMAVVPAGTANNVARSLGVGIDPARAIAALPAAVLRHVDLGVVTATEAGAMHGAHFLEGFGVGIFADVMAERATKEHKALRRAFRLIAQELEAYEPHRIEVTIDGRDASGEYVLAAVMNLRSLGPALRLAPDAAFDDGALDVVLVGAADRQALVTPLKRAALLGRLTLPRFDVRRAERVRFRGGTPPLGARRRRRVPVRRRRRDSRRAARGQLPLAAVCRPPIARGAARRPDPLSHARVGEHDHLVASRASRRPVAPAVSVYNRPMAVETPDFDAREAPRLPSRHTLFLLRRDLTIHWANEVGKRFAERAWGRVPQPGDSMLDFAVESTAEDFRGRVERAFAGESSSVRRELTYPSGLRLVFDVFYDPVPGESGTIDLVAFAAVDVSADVVRGDVVRLLAAGLSQTTDGVLIADAKGDLPVVYANDATLRITGYARDEIVGRNCRFLQRGDTDQDGVRVLRAAIRGGRACQALLRNYRKDGTLFYNQFTLAPIRDGAGDVTHYIGVQRDVTAERKQEERLAATERMEALGRLASGVAHDINNLLMAVVANVDVLRETEATATSHAAELERIQTTIGRARALTSQLLTFASMRVSEPVVVDVGRRVAALADLLQTLVPARIRLTVRTEAAPLPVMIDPAHVEQLVMNLAVNARDAMPRGGTLDVVVEHDDAPPELAGPAVKIAVRDTGEGMSEEVRARAFEPFFTTKPSGSGTGLGLATCFGIASRYGGHIALASRLGEGTTCTVWLPRSARAPDAPLGPEASAPPPARRTIPPGTRVLLVEDNEAVRAAIVRTLRKAGCVVLEAEDGAVAVRLLEREPVDVLVTDQVLPSLSGIEVAEAARRLHPHVVQVFMTGYAGQDLAESGLPAGAALLEKPFSLRDLVAKIADLLVTARPGGG